MLVLLRQMLAWTQSYHVQMVGCGHSNFVRLQLNQSDETFLPISVILVNTANGKAAEFGPLKEGLMFETSTGLSRM